MSVQDNKNAVTAFFRCLERGDVESMERYVDDGVRWWVQGKGEQDKAGVCGNFRQLVGITTDRSATVRQMFGEGEQLYAEIDTRFTFQGGGVLENRIGLALDMCAGKVVGAREYMDTDKVRAFFAAQR